MFPAPLSSSHYPGEMAIQIDSYPARGLFLALTHASPVGEQAGHLWYDSAIAAPTTLPGRSGLLTHLALVLRQWPHAHRTSSGSAHFILAGLPA